MLFLLYKFPGFARHCERSEANRRFNGVNLRYEVLTLDCFVPRNDAIASVLFYNHLLGLDIVAVGELEHVGARSGIDGDMGGAVDGFSADDAAGHVDDLQIGFALVVHRPVEAVVEGEIGVLIDASGIS